MIVDASAILAVILAEPDADSYAERLWRPERRRMSAVNYLEAAIRVDRIGIKAFVDALATLIEVAGIDVVPATPHHATIAREAYRRYGKGNHKAKLNFADCFAYALARDTGEPLLFKGGDFARTDIVAAV